MPLRVVIAICLALAPAVATAQDPGSSGDGLSSIVETSGFQLGGAVTRAALVPESEGEGGRDIRLPRLALPIAAMAGALTQSERKLGPATLFMGERFEAGRDSLLLGTFLSRGGARAGMSVTYEQAQEQLSRSELFVDYALTETFSVGVSGILNTEPEEEDGLRQLGISAGFAAGNGAFLQGGVASAPDYDPIIGLSVGLRF